MMPHRQLLDTACRLWRHPSVKPQEILDFQTRKLRVLIDHVYRHVPYYRRMFDSLGDIAEKGPDLCSCGQPFSTLNKIQGRTDDYFGIPDGRFVYPDEIVMQPIVSREDSWVQQYQLVQEKENRVVLDIEALYPPTPEDIENIEKTAADALGPEVDFHVRLVDKIPFEPSGKSRVRRSLVKSDFNY